MPSRALLVLALAWPFAGSHVPAEYAVGHGLRAAVIAEGLESPLYVTAPAGDPRLFIVEQSGRIRILRDGRLLGRPFLDLSRRVTFGGERGLLGLAFDPEYARNGRFFVNFSDSVGDTRVERYRVSEDSDRADPASALLVLRVEQPYANHNGGMVAFGPDRMLYVGMGDGGSHGDPHGNGQNLDALLGKMLRLDVSGRKPYAIPPDNPFAHRPGAQPEIWAFGLRNPWRFSFDRERPMLYIGDVGQDRWEEVDVVDARAPGLNFGWNLREGAHPFRGEPQQGVRLIEPVLEFGHDEGCSVIGGYVYRGRELAGLQGTYFFSDYCRGRLRSFRLANGRATELREWDLGRLGSVTSFGEDASGELYVTTQEGRVLALLPAK